MALFLELLERQFPLDSPARPLRLRTASDYAACLSVHVNYLNRTVRTLTGKPTTAHIAERILGEAKVLLRHTTWPVADIAHGLGFAYPTYFNNFFKQHTGLTPTALRA
ncbi:MAG: helix-turn-helix domain-containing protein [Hymenobacter sp.]